MIAYHLGLTQIAELAYNLASQSAIDGGNTGVGDFVTTDAGDTITLDNGEPLITG